MSRCGSEVIGVFHGRVVAVHDNRFGGDSALAGAGGQAAVE